MPKRVVSIVGVGRRSARCAERTCETFGARACMHERGGSGWTDSGGTGKQRLMRRSGVRWMHAKKTKGFQPLNRASWVAGFSPFPLCLSSPLLWYASTDGPPSPEVTDPPGPPCLPRARRDAWCVRANALPCHAAAPRSARLLRLCGRLGQRIFFFQSSTK